MSCHRNGRHYAFLVLGSVPEHRRPSAFIGGFILSFRTRNSNAGMVNGFAVRSTRPPASGKHVKIFTDLTWLKSSGGPLPPTHESAARGGRLKGPAMTLDQCAGVSAPLCCRMRGRAGSWQNARFRLSPVGADRDRTNRVSSNFRHDRARSLVPNPPRGRWFASARSPRPRSCSKPPAHR